MRARAKTINFGVIYGMGATRLARELSISFAEARAFIEAYFAKMPGVRRFQEETMARARRDGMVRTITGRRRFLRGIAGGDARARAQAERMAINTPIQGSAADLIKQAMLEVERRLVEARIARSPDPAGARRTGAGSTRGGGLRRRRASARSDGGSGPAAAERNGRWRAAAARCEAGRRAFPPVGVEPRTRARSFSEIPVAGEVTAPERLAVPLRVDLGYGANWDEAHA